MYICQLTGGTVRAQLWIKAGLCCLVVYELLSQDRNGRFLFSLPAWRVAIGSGVSLRLPRILDHCWLRLCICYEFRARLGI